MIRSLTILVIFLLYSLSSEAQSNSGVKEGKTTQIARFVGQYEMEGMIIQFGLQKEKLILVVPGAPIQLLENVGKNKFKSTVFKNAFYLFAENNGKVTSVDVVDERGSHTLKKINDRVEILSVKMDSLFTLQKSTKHFLFMYTATDSISIDSIAASLEKNYNRILADFKVKSIPKVTVRIYPDMTSFHKGINFPTAPDNVLATAFGTDDLRTVSPNSAGSEAWMLAYMGPHEFTHVVHLNVDYSPNNPRWLWEGVAQYEAGWFFNPKDIESILKKEFPHLAELNNGMEYMLGFAIIEAIKDIWGFDTVLNLIKNHGDIKKELQMDEKQFEQKIFEHMYIKYVQN
jgi:hypothetical protein